MAESDLILLKNIVPVKDAGRVREDVREFHLDIQPHHLLGGVHDRGAPVRGLELLKQGLRGGVGQDPLGRAVRPKLKHAPDFVPPIFPRNKKAVLQ